MYKCKKCNFIYDIVNATQDEVLEAIPCPKCNHQWIELYFPIEEYVELLKELHHISLRVRWAPDETELWLKAERMLGIK